MRRSFFPTAICIRRIQHVYQMLLGLLGFFATTTLQGGVDDPFKRWVANLGSASEKAAVGVFEMGKLLETACTNAAVETAKLFEPSSRNMEMCAREAYRTSRCFYSMNGLLQADSSVCDLSEERRLRMLTMAKCVAAVYSEGKLPTGYAEPSHDWMQRLNANLGDSSHQIWSKGGRIVFDSGMSVRIMREEPAGELIVAFAGVETENDGRIEAAMSAILSGESKGQLNDGAMLLKAMLSIHDGHVVVTGHSFGGLLAVYAVVSQKSDSRVECILFNPLGVPYMLQRSMDVVRLQAAAETMTTIQHPQDFARFLLGRHPGKVFLLPDENAISPKEAHSIRHVIAVLSAIVSQD